MMAEDRGLGRRMPAIGGVVSRLPRVVCGYCLACLAVSYSGLLLFLPVAVIAWVHGGDLESTEDLMLGLRYYVLLAPFLALSAGAYAVAPAMLAIVYAEARRVRSSLFYVSAGSIIATLCFAVAELWSGQFRLSERSPVSFQIHSAAGIALMAVILGIIGGLVYWAIAGRSAGAWRRSPAAATHADRVASRAT